MRAIRNKKIDKTVRVQLKMAKKKVDFGKGVYNQPRTRCNSSNTKYFKTISPPPTKNDAERAANFNANATNKTPSPVRGVSPSSNPRTSPGLLAGHYAGCKFTEPPLPSALPPPPKHWIQTSHPVWTTFKPEVPEQQSLDIAHQLKVLLKVQA